MTWEPRELRWLATYIEQDGKPVEAMSRLQQRWVRGDEEEWREVPEVSG
jgi:hypothetical protein